MKMSNFATFDILTKQRKDASLNRAWVHLWRLQGTTVTKLLVAIVAGKTCTQQMDKQWKAKMMKLAGKNQSLLQKKCTLFLPQCNNLTVMTDLYNNAEFKESQCKLYRN